MTSYSLVDGVMTSRRLSDEEVVEFEQSMYRQFDGCDRFGMQLELHVPGLPGCIRVEISEDENEIFHDLPATDEDTQSYEIGYIYEKSDPAGYEANALVEGDSVDLWHWRLDERSSSWGSGVYVKLGEGMDFMAAVLAVVEFTFVDRRDVRKNDRLRTMTMLDFVPEQDRGV